MSVEPNTLRQRETRTDTVSNPDTEDEGLEPELEELSPVRLREMARALGVEAEGLSDGDLIEAIFRELPDPAVMTFEEWKAMSSGAFTLEAKVSEHVVRPLLERYVFKASDSRPDRRLDMTAFFGLEVEHRAASGFVDFLFKYPAHTPALVVEVKPAIRRSPTGSWADSPDFQQLRRYMDDLGTPGLLIDAHSLLLVEPGAEAPYAEIVRSEATWDDIAMIRDLILGPQRYMIVYGNPYDDARTTDMAVVVAMSMDSPVLGVEPAPDGDEQDFLLIKSFLEDYPHTPRQVVGRFGLSGMHRALGAKDSGPVRFALASFPFMTEEPGRPFAILTAADHDRDSIPLSIEVHPDADEVGVREFADLLEAFERDPSSFSVGRLAASYGWIEQIAGSSPESPAPREKRPRRILRRG